MSLWHGFCVAHHPDEFPHSTLPSLKQTSPPHVPLTPLLPQGRRSRAEGPDSSCLPLSPPPGGRLDPPRPAQPSSSTQSPSSMESSNYLSLSPPPSAVRKECASPSSSLRTTEAKKGKSKASPSLTCFYALKTSNSAEILVSRWVLFNILNQGLDFLPSNQQSCCTRGAGRSAASRNVAPP